MKNKELLERMSQRVSRLTNKIWNESVDEIVEKYIFFVSEDMDKSEFRSYLKQGYGWKINAKYAVLLQTKVRLASDLYLQKMIKFSTHDLNCIVWLHKNYMPKRAEETIQAILTELTERLFFSDSDSNNNDGEKYHAESQGSAISQKVDS